LGDLTVCAVPLGQNRAVLFKAAAIFLCSCGPYIAGDIFFDDDRPKSAARLRAMLRTTRELSCYVTSPLDAWFHVA
jgi:hypothetical protein